MAFTFYTGVHMAQAATCDFVAHPNEIGVSPTVGNPTGSGAGAIRVITWPGDNATNVAQLVTRAQTAGKYVVLCLTPGGNVFSSITPANWANVFSGLIAAGAQPDAWEIGNEPGANTSGQGSAVNGPYWPLLVSGANRLKQLQPNVPRILTAPYSDSGINLHYSNGDTYFNGLGDDIRNYVTDWAIHLYSPSPSAAQAKLTSARNLVDGFTKSWSAMPCHVTEFGWTSYAPPGTPTTMVATLPQMASNMQAMMDWFIANRQSKKIRGAYWFLWQDTAGLKSVPTGYYGLKKNTHVESANSPQAGVKPTPISTSANGYRANPKNMMDSYQAVYDPPAGVVQPAPTVVTQAATSVSQTAALMHGTVNPEGAPTTFNFEYSTSPTLASYTSTTVGQAGSGSSPTNAQALIGNLTPGTTYYFRIKATNSGGTSRGSILSFPTLAPPQAPTVITGSATLVTDLQATLNGLLDPDPVLGSGVLTLGGPTLVAPATILGQSGVGGGGTTWWFQWGTTTSFGNETPHVVTAGVDLVSVSRTITPLVGGTTYYYRLVAQDGSGTTYGLTKSFSTVRPAAPALDGPASLLPLELSVEIETADGRIYRWDAEAADERNRPYEVNFATQAGDGFAEASCIVNRQIGLDWPDLALLTKGRFIGADATVAYEGRVTGMPRSVGDEGERISVQFQGLMSSATDRPFMELYVCRSTEGWQAPSLPLRKALMAANWPLDADYTTTVDTGSVHQKGTTQKTIPIGSQSVVEYVAPNGVLIASMQYKGDQTNMASVEAPRLIGGGDDSVRIDLWPEQVGLTLNGTTAIQTAPFSTPRKYAALRLACTTSHSPAAAVPAHRRYDELALYGDHDVPLHGNGTDPAGVYASDVIQDIVGRFCPMLDASQVSPTETMISHLVFDSPTTPFDAITLLNGYHLYKLAVWEDGELMFEPADLTKADWRVRHDEYTSIELQGDTTDQFANGIVVSYTDVDQRNQVLWPSSFPELRDDDPDNPANKQGIELFTTLELSVPADRNGALALGQAALAEFNRPKAPGTLTVTLGYLEDANGNLAPGWKVRYGQTVAITDLPNDAPRLITATQWGEDGSLQITLEQPSTRIDAVIARQELNASTRGL